jgi:hypothetical protein
MNIQAIADMIKAGDYEYYGLRAHRREPVIGKSLGKSRVWIDGECTDDELDGISAVRVKAGDDLDAIIDRLRREYCWEAETIVLIGGYIASQGEDRGEIIIRDNICLAVLS